MPLLLTGRMFSLLTVLNEGAIRLRLRICVRLLVMLSAGVVDFCSFEIVRR